MRVLRVFNNNVVLTRDELGREVVVTGRGVGFQARPGDPIDPALIVRRFVPAENPSSIAQVIADIPLERLTLVERLFAEAMRDLGAALPPLAIVAVADHIHQAIERVKRGEMMEYPLRAEVAHLHPEELEVAEHLLDKLNRDIETPLPRGEAIALAMHLFHAVTGSPSMEQTFVQSRLIRQIFDIVEHAYGEEFDPDSIDAARFATHLRYFFARARSGKQLSGDVPEVAIAVSDSNSRAHQLALRIKALLELRLQLPITHDETVYLTMHVARMEAGMHSRA
ncbi:MAG: PRD domain-containing protein [Micropruina sp.]|uniref:PRD domain-containing protein n=1 Tax=Micropruina sp. TaxID=2737536 RepID=UPI0039E2E14B